jgi:hypothetical protein
VKKSLTAILATAFIATLPLVASAGEVHNRLNHENARIDQGVKSGQLTQREYDHLDAREDAINASRERDLKANGGKLTPQEYRNLNRRENGLSDSIYFDKHNLRRQPGAPKL